MTQALGPQKRVFGSALGLGLGTIAGDRAEMTGVEPASEHSPQPYAAVAAELWLRAHSASVALPQRRRQLLADLQSRGFEVVTSACAAEAGAALPLLAFSGVAYDA